MSCDAACNCDRAGAESSQCDESGRCRCKPGFEGLQCQRSNCPSCFGPIKQKVTSHVAGPPLRPIVPDHLQRLFLFFQMASYAAELQQLHSVFSQVDSGLTSSGAEAEAVLRNVENLVDDLREDTEVLAGNEG